MWWLFALTPPSPASIPLPPPLSQEVTVTQEEDRQATASEEVADLEQRLADLVSKQKVLDQRITRISGQKSLLNDFSTNLISAGRETKTANLMESKTVGEWNCSLKILFLLRSRFS